MSVNTSSSRDSARESRNNRARSQTKNLDTSTVAKPPGTAEVRSGQRRSGEPRDSVDITPESPERKRSSVGGLIDSIADWAGFGGDDANVEEAAAPDQGPTLDLNDKELLSRGRNSDPKQVTRLQEMLKERGADIAVDGKFGPETERAVLDFQGEKGLKVDGIVGPETQAAINGASEAEKSVSEPETDATKDLNEPKVDPSTNLDAPTLEGIPPRPADAPGGTEFLKSIEGLSTDKPKNGGLSEREQAVLDEIMKGNIPDSSRLLKELTVNRNGKEIKMHVMPDYLSIGSDKDNVRVPMTPGVAQTIAERTGTSLPTTKIVDDVYDHSTKLHMPALTNDRSGIETYLAHDRKIDSLLGTGDAQTELVSGHKKDLVIPIPEGRVAIYGGRWPDGDKIQKSRYVGHGDYYEDYSHGVRLVSQDVVIDGQKMQLADALKDPTLASLFM